MKFSLRSLLIFVTVIACFFGIASTIIYFASKTGEALNAVGQQLADDEPEINIDVYMGDQPGAVIDTEEPSMIIWSGGGPEITNEVELDQAIQRMKAREAKNK